ncbi:MAG: pyridoxamine 5'-phosphate oxidase family protein [Miltoncostaeaceae bacterium]
MARFEDLRREAPAVAETVERFLRARVHHTLATLRPDGSPRISGTEVLIAHGDLWLGSMWHSPKARDLMRDGRYALHGGSDDPPAWGGDVKVAGRAEVVDDPEVVAAVMATRPGGEIEPAPVRFHMFRLEIAEAVTLALPDPPEHLLATTWREGRGVVVRHLDP